MKEKTSDCSFQFPIECHTINVPPTLSDLSYSYRRFFYQKIHFETFYKKWYFNHGQNMLSLPKNDGLSNAISLRLQTGRSHRFPVFNDEISLFFEIGSIFALCED